MISVMRQSDHDYLYSSFEHELKKKKKTIQIMYTDHLYMNYTKYTNHFTQLHIFYSQITV